MSRKSLSVAVLCFALGVLTSSVIFSDVFFALAPVVADPSEGLLVHNLDTGLSYAGIQEAIDATGTLDGHEIRVGYGIFQERVVVSKSVSLVGEGSDASIIDGMRGEVVVDVVSDGVEIRNLGIRNGAFGLLVDHADGCRIIGNSIHDGSYGLRLYHSRNSYVTGNTVSGYGFFGIEIDSSGNTTLRGNLISQNKYGFGVDGRTLEDFVNDIDSSNLVNGKPIRYLLNQRDSTVDSSVFQDIGFLGLVNSTNVVVCDLEMQDSVQGVLLAFAANSSIVDLKVSDNFNGVYVTHSRNVTVSGVKAYRNFDYGIKFFNCSGSRASKNNADGNGWAGVGLFGSPFSVVEGNHASYGTYGLHIVRTNNSVIEGNTVEYSEGDYGIAVFYSHHNLIFHNVFANSLLFAESRDSAKFVPSNKWDNGVEGNFWFSYNGVDHDRDGIGDAAYSLGQNNVDGYPLMGRFFEFDVFVQDTSYGVGVVSNSSISGFMFDLDARQIEFAARSEAGTMGFSRVSVPRKLLQASSSDDLAFLVNGKEPVSLRKWTDESHAYWYLSYANIMDWIWLSEFSIVFAIFLLMIILLLAIVWRWRKAAK